MGLFGPSWSWEEIQKKDALMGELKKENNRVLNEQRLENDRMISEIQDIPRQQAQNRIVQREGARYKSARLALKTVTCAYLVLGNYRKVFLKFSLNSKKVKGYSKGGLFACVKYAFIACCILLLLGILNMGFESWAPLAILKDFLFLLAFATMIFLFRYIPTKSVSKKIENNECYQKILSYCQGKDIDEIGIMSDMVRIRLKNGKKENFRFIDYGYGYLNFFNQGILLGLLIKNLGLKFDVYVDEFHFSDDCIFTHSELSDGNFEVDMIPFKLYMSAYEGKLKKPKNTLKKW